MIGNDECPCSPSDNTFNQRKACPVEHIHALEEFLSWLHTVSPIDLTLIIKSLEHAQDEPPSFDVAQRVFSPLTAVSRINLSLVGMGVNSRLESDFC